MNYYGGGISIPTPVMEFALGAITCGFPTILRVLVWAVSIQLVTRNVTGRKIARPAGVAICVVDLEVEVVRTTHR
jgi:hypothetical protein